MFKIGKVINIYNKIGVTIVSLSGSLTVGDKIKLFKDGECLLTQKVDQIKINQENIPYAKAGDVVALFLNHEKIKKGSEIYREGSVGA